MSSTFANKILKDLSSFDDISIKTFFGGFSINCKGVMFGWIGEQEFYLRIIYVYLWKIDPKNMNLLKKTV